MKMITKLLSCLVVLLATGSSFANGHPPCGDVVYAGPHETSCGCPEVSYVERVVHVPCWTTERRKVTVTEYRTEPRTRIRTVYQRVPVNEERTCTYTEWVPEYRTEKRAYTVHVPVTKKVKKTYQVRVPFQREVEQTCTVMVPHREERTYTRMVCKPYTETSTRTITRDLGHWETRMYEVPCAPYGYGAYRTYRIRCGCVAVCGCEPIDCCPPPMRTVCRRVWVPNLVTEQVPCTVTRYEYVPQQYTKYVTVYRPEKRTRKVLVNDCRIETHTKVVDVVCYERRTEMRDCTYTVSVPHRRTKTYTVTTCKLVAKQVEETCHVRIPVQVQKEVDVPVCHMVAKTVLVPVYCGGCDDYCGCHVRRCWRWRPFFGCGFAWGCCGW